MKKRRLPVVPTIIAAYRDLGRLLAAMPALMLSAFLIVLAVSATVELIPQRWWDHEVFGEVLGHAEDAAKACLLTPVVIAIHRFVILEKITPRYTVPVGESVFAVFFAWLFGLKLLLGLPLDLFGVLLALAWPPRVSIAVFAVAMIAAVAVVLRLTILLPALAVGTRGATASRAVADSKGQALRILAVFVIALVPWLAVAMGGATLLGPGAMRTGSPLAMLSLVISGVIQTITVALTTIIASYAFMVLADRVKRTA